MNSKEDRLNELEQKVKELVCITLYLTESNLLIFITAIKTEIFCNFSCENEEEYETLIIRMHVSGNDSTNFMQSYFLKSYKILS